MVVAADARYLRDAVVDDVPDVYDTLTFTLDAAPPKSTRMFISQNCARRSARPAPSHPSGKFASYTSRAPLRSPLIVPLVPLLL